MQPYASSAFFKILDVVFLTLAYSRDLDTFPVPVIFSGQFCEKKSSIAMHMSLHSGLGSG